MARIGADFRVTLLEAGFQHINGRAAPLRVRAGCDHRGEMRDVAIGAGGIDGGQRAQIGGQGCHVRVAERIARHQVIEDMAAGRYARAQRMRQAGIGVGGAGAEREILVGDALCAARLSANGHALDLAEQIRAGHRRRDIAALAHAHAAAAMAMNAGRVGALGHGAAGAQSAQRLAGNQPAVLIDDASGLDPLGQAGVGRSRERHEREERQAGGQHAGKVRSGCFHGPEF